MIVLVPILFVGYMLIYAAVHDGGSSARRPWETLRGGSASARAAGEQGGGGSTAGKVGGIVRKVIGIASPLP